MKFKYTVSLDEYINFNKTVTKKQRIISHMVFVICYMFILIMLDFLSLFAILFSAIFFYFIGITEIKSKCKKVYENSKELKEETTITIKENEILEEDIFSSSTLKFEDMYQFKEDKVSYYIFIDPIKALIIPKRIMNEEEKQEFKKIVSVYFKK